MAIAIEQEGRLIDASKVADPIRDKIRQAREHRKQFEPTWHSNLAYASGKHWLTWDKDSRTLRRLEDVDARYRGRELYTADLITERRTTVLGELGSDDDRPELLLARDDAASEDFQEHVNRALAFGWDYEFYGDQVLAEADRLMIDLGTAAVRCRWEADFGDAVAEDVPFYEGKPVMDSEQATQLMGQYEEGPIPGVQMQDVRQGRIVWEPLSAFNLLPPPGVTNERYFPWECIIWPQQFAEVKAEFPEETRTMREDTDISSTLGTEAQQQGSSDPAMYAIGEGRQTRLRDHVWRFAFFERPSKVNPQGRVYHFAGNNLTILRVDEALPYQCPDGQYSSGITYLHWWRVTGRFWSRALIEAMKDPQRIYNKRRVQTDEIIDRGLPYVLATEGSEVDRPGRPMDVLKYPRDGAPPTPVQGIGPGPWMAQDLEELRGDLELASGLRGPTLGDNPTNVSTYSQLALLREADVVKREVMLSERKRAIAKLVEYSVYDIRTYWGPEKHMAIAGDEGQVEAMIFDATKIPDFFIVRIAKGSAKPRSQAAELQKVEQIWMAALAGGAVMLNPPGWIDWYKESLDAGQVMDIPSEGADAQEEKADLENHLLMQGQQVEPAYYDPLEVHVAQHRGAQIEMELSGNIQAVLAIEKHVQRHLMLAKENIAAMSNESAAQLPPPPPVAPGGPETSPEGPQGAPAEEPIMEEPVPEGMPV